MTDEHFESFDMQMQPPLDEVDFANPKDKKKKIVVAIVCVLLVVIFAVSCALLVKTYVVTSFIVNGVSMYPTLDGGNGQFGDAIDTNGEVLYLNKLAKVNRGDIVVVNPPWDALKRYDKESGKYVYINLVKRVIAVGGDKVEIKDGKVILNGSILDEPYIYEQMGNSYDNQSWTVDEGHIFCMGDNRNNSSDSRAYGQVSLDDVVGKCFLIKGIDGKLRTPK